MYPRLKPTGITVVPEGKYQCNVADIESDTSQHGDVLKFKFEVSDGEHTGTNIVGLTSHAWSSQSKLRQWALAIGQRVWAGDEELDCGDLVDRPCRIVVEAVEKVVNDSPMMVNRITQVLAPVVGQKKQKTAEVAQETVASVPAQGSLEVQGLAT